MKEELKSIGVYFGDPLENKIIGSGDLYVVIHNPTELALTIMDQEAKKYCKQTFEDNFTSNFMKILGRYTTYFSCEMRNQIDQYNLSDQEKNVLKIEFMNLKIV